eukprot:6206662-Pleurochrysis_carterae.AAC.2
MASSQMSQIFTIRKGSFSDLELPSQDRSSLAERSRSMISQRASHRLCYAADASCSISDATATPPLQLKHLQVTFELHWSTRLQRQ